VFVTGRLRDRLPMGDVLPRGDFVQQSLILAGNHDKYRGAAMLRLLLSMLFRSWSRQSRTPKWAVPDQSSGATFLALRRPDDEYESRAWCAAEVSVDSNIERTQCKKIVLRLDRLDQKISEQSLLEGDEHTLSMRKTFVEMLSLPGAARLPIDRIARYIYMFGAEAEDDRACPMFVVKRPPRIFEGQLRFLDPMIYALSRLSDQDARIRDNLDPRGLGVDIVNVITEAARKVGLKTSNSDDMRYTCLLILYSRHRGRESFAAFYAECLKRVLEGRSTVLRR
jgi:hypothetical protein